jgi:hypothetical protein
MPTFYIKKQELLNVCNDMSPEAASFERPKNTDSIGYRVHIKGAIHERVRQASGK